MADRPYTLIAELTYRCPLRCPYCSNPVELDRHSSELTTDEWQRVFAEAESLGVVQLHLTGGEPLLRRDLESLVARARALDLYTNLITSGVPLARERLSALHDAGLDHVQLSIQDAIPAESDRMAGLDSFERKLEVAAWVKEERLPLTLNCVLHRDNLDRVEAIIALAERLGADRLELANTQYLGWALPNRAALLPSGEQLARASEIAAEAAERLTGRMVIVFVKPDYWSAYPKACMDGWGRRFITVSPAGLVLPCHAAHTLPGLRFDSVRDLPLDRIWRESEALNRFRGEEWMPETCASCPRKTVDFGGCRCQAFHLTGDAAAVDPACSLSPDHRLVEIARESASRPAPQLLYRTTHHR
jgi:pyrroloquinoline quinone biosynthesis protein E